MRFLCISDIHGNNKALEAVLEAAKDWGYDQLVVCGDLCFPGPEPLKVWNHLVKARALCVQGLTDKAISVLDPDELPASTPEEESRLKRLAEVHEELGDLILERMRRLPTIARIPLESGHEMVITHGSPADATISMTPDLTDDDICDLLGNDPAELIICGGDHVPFQRILDDVRIVGVGSVGESPTKGVAHATLVTSTPTQTSIEQKEVVLE